jgi:hypothetical protein
MSLVRTRAHHYGEDNMLARASMKIRGAMGYQPHHSQATTTIGIMATTSQRPSDIFSIGDIIKIIGNSKHRGRVATIQRIGA